MWTTRRKVLAAITLSAAVGVCPPASAGASERLEAMPSPSVTMQVTSARSWVAPARPVVLVHHFDPPAQAWLAGHRGADLAVAQGDPVYAPTSGVVTFAGMLAGRGVVVVTRDDGLRATLEPVAALVSVGDPVTAGQPVGRLDASPGVSHCDPQPCLHWGVLRGQTYLDPMRLLSPPRVVLLPMP